MDDGALLDAWRSGSREAGQALIERHYAAVFRFFHGKVAEHVREDLSQRTFEVLCRKPADFRGEGSFRAYLFGIARRVLLGARRSRPLEPLDDEPLPAGDPSPSAALADAEMTRVVATALRSLAVDDQILIELKDWEGLSQAELAALFEVPQPTVARRLQRARARLREAVEALCDDPVRREASLRNLDSCVQSIRALIEARWGRVRAGH